MRREGKKPPSLLVREACRADNDALIDLELRSPLVVAGAEESYDRSPDFFACHRLQGDHRVVLAEMDGRPVGVMAGVIQSPVIQGRARRLLYIQRARVHRDYQGRGVAWVLASDLFTWSRQFGAEGPYYLIAPGNERSVAFGGRAGRRWPVDLRLLAFDVSGIEGARPRKVSMDQLGAVVEFVNSTHTGEDFFGPLTLGSLRERLSRDSQYGIENLYGVVEGGRLAAVSGLWDKGATTEEIRVDRATGSETRSRSTVVVDWGWAPGGESAFARLLRSLGVASRALGRQAMMICEPSPGMVPDSGLHRHEISLNLYTPTIDPPAEGSVSGLCADLLTL